MNELKLSAAGVDVAEGIRRFNGNAKMYEKYVGRFPNDPDFAALCGAVASGDVKSAFTAAHTLKGVAGNLSMTKLYDDICPLVEELRAGSLENAGKYLDTVKRDYDGITAAIAPSEM